MRDFESCISGLLIGWIDGSKGFPWDWMIISGAPLSAQLGIDLTAPLLIVLFFRANNRYYLRRPLLEDDESKPMWLRNLWKYLLAGLYIWFFSATYYDFLYKAH